MAEKQAGTIPIIERVQNTFVAKEELSRKKGEVPCSALSDAGGSITFAQECMAPLMDPALFNDKTRLLFREILK